MKIKNACNELFFNLILLSICISLFMLSCNDKGVKNSFKGAEEIVIDVRDQTALPYDSIFSTISYIKLETTDDNLIGVISQVIFIDSLIVVVDKEYARSINVFNSSGKFLYSLGRRGNGPGEYVEIKHVAFDCKNRRLSIFDHGQNKIIHYKPEGEYISSEKTPFFMSSFEYLGNGAKAYYKHGMRDESLGKFKDNPLIVTDSLNKPLYGDCHVYYEQNKFTSGIIDPLRMFDGEVIFSPDFSNVIYTVTDSMVIPKYHINIAWNGMPPIDSNTTSEMLGEYYKKYYWFNGDIMELEDFTYINIGAPKGYPFVLYSHDREKTYFCNEQCSHPIHPFLDNNVPKARFKDNTVVYTVSSDFLQFNSQELYKVFESHGAWLDSFYDGLTEESNPVLVFCKINENL